MSNRLALDSIPTRVINNLPIFAFIVDPPARCICESWMNVQLAYPLHLFDNRIDFLFYQTKLDCMPMVSGNHDWRVWEFPNARNRIKTIRRNRVCRSKYWIILSICNFCKLRLIRRPAAAVVFAGQFQPQRRQMPSIKSTGRRRIHSGCGLGRRELIILMARMVFGYSGPKWKISQEFDGWWWRCRQQIA